MTEDAISPYYQPTLRVRLMATGGILAVFGVVLCFFFLTMPSDVFYEFIGFLGLYLMPGFGKESIVPLAMAFVLVADYSWYCCRRYGTCHHYCLQL